ncbi:MAG: hypothetical protein KI786_05730 [Mameliella sp.]|nr:hypothetical protein [Phaeodactylibacter sp.]
MQHQFQRDFYLANEIASTNAELTNGTRRTLAFLDTEGAVVNIGSATLASQECIYVHANGRTSAAIKPSEVIAARASLYKVGQVNVWTVDLADLDGTEDGYVTVIVLTPGNNTLPRRSIDGNVAADFNGIEDQYFTTAVSGNTLTITAKEGESIAIATGMALEGATVTETQVFEPSNGKPSDVERIESIGLPKAGITNKVGFPVVKPVSVVEEDEAYDLIYIKARPVTDAAHGMNAIDVGEFEIAIACARGTGTPVGQLAPVASAINGWMNP